MRWICHAPAESGSFIRATWRLKSVRFLDLASAHAALYNLVKKPQHVGQVDPKSTIQAPSIEAPIHQRVMALDHHETFAFQAVHRMVLGSDCREAETLVVFRQDVTSHPGDAVHRRRFKISARQPAKSPPPKMVVPKERYALVPAECVP
jgi:hypothetical protein